MLKEYVCYLTVQKEIAVCEKSFWEQNHCLDDHHDKDLCLWMTSLGFHELRTNVFARPAHYTAAEAINKLVNNGFTEVERRLHDGI